MKMTTARARVIGALLSFPNGDVRAADVVARADLPSGTAYPILNTLVDQGVLASLIVSPNSERKTAYRLDGAGRRALQRLMDEFILKTPGLTFTPVHDGPADVRAATVADFLEWAATRQVRLAQWGEGEAYGVNWLDLVVEWVNRDKVASAQEKRAILSRLQERRSGSSGETGAGEHSDGERL